MNVYIITNYNVVLMKCNDFHNVASINVWSFRKRYITLCTASTFLHVSGECDKIDKSLDDRIQIYGQSFFLRIHVRFIQLISVWTELVGTTQTISFKFNPPPPPPPKKKNGRHFADDVFKCISMIEMFCISIRISLKFVPKGPIDTMLALVQVMAWCRTGGGVGRGWVNCYILGQFLLIDAIYKVRAMTIPAIYNIYNIML